MSVRTHPNVLFRATTFRPLGGTAASNFTRAIQGVFAVGFAAQGSLKLGSVPYF